MPTVLLVATDLDQPGGVASVLRTWRAHGLFTDHHVRLIGTNSGNAAIAKTWSALRAWIQCAWLIPGPSVRVVHVHTSSYISFWRKTPIIALSIVFRKALIVSLHGGAFQSFYANGNALRQAWIRLILRRANRFVVLTPVWERWVMEIEPCARVAVIPNPAPNVPPVPQPRRPDAQPTLLFLGRVEQAKGIDHLINALALAHRAGATWRLRVAGSGDIDAAQRLAQSAMVQIGAIEFLGWVDGPSKTALIDDCDLLVLPSLMENMPVVLLEAWARGRPVLASRVGGVPDMVEDESDGFLVASGDSDMLAQALISAWHRRHRLPAMGLAGHVKVSRLYSPTAVVEQVKLLWRSCL